MALASPVRHQIADPVDRLVLGYPILRPLGIKGLLAAATTRRRDRNEVGAEAPRLGDLVGDAVVVEAEVERRLGVRRVQDRVLDDDWHDRRRPFRCRLDGSRIGMR